MEEYNCRKGDKIVIHSISDSDKIDNLSFLISQRSVDLSHVSDDIIFEKETNIITIKEVLPRSKFTIYTK